MSKKDKPEPAMLPSMIVEYPQSLLVRYVNHGTDDQYLLVGEAPNDIETDDGTTKVARYVLVGTGVIQHTAAQYVEHTKA